MCYLRIAEGSGNWETHLRGGFYKMRLPSVSGRVRGDGVVLSCNFKLTDGPAGTGAAYVDPER